MVDFDPSYIVDQWFRMNDDPEPAVVYPHTTTCKCIVCEQEKPVTFKTAGEYEDFVDNRSYIDWVCRECEDALERAQIERYEAGLH